MAIPSLLTDSVVRIGDKFRLDATRTFLKPGETLTSIDLELSDGGDSYNLYQDSTNETTPDQWFIDYAYELDDSNQVTLTIVSSLGTKSLVKTVVSKIEADDLTLATDSDLIAHESNIMEYLPNGRNSFIYMHRNVTELILQNLSERRILKNDGAKLDASDLVDQDEFKKWAKYYALMLIFESQSNSVDDIFRNKYNFYKSLMTDALKSSSLRVDKNDDDVVDNPIDLFSGDMVRR